ncbi:SDR family oxidoreductase [Sporosarcina sp. ACRSM]|uniref:SDR family oxidoreductase n=1 Tax=Sporosarcina sp. ACRSM TaxID=2918216 RepID=UPI001EF72B52|nr:SDR family oxidoreductase [Sporosarcina sp. ACRSM]MCG7337023.1 SDR family oxidoreductase [Sporosarcina sp. ACRSM]
MKVLVIGANGQIGKQVVQLLQESDEHTVRAMVRDEAQAAALQAKGVEAVVADLEGSVDEFATAMQGCDAVIFSAGSGGHTGPDKTLLVDLDGAVKSMEAAEKVGIHRYVMVSAIQAHNRESWANSPIKPYMVAKHFADKSLMASNLNYTIVRPGALTNDTGTGRVSASENLQRDSIPREDVAHTLIAVLNEENTFKRSFDLVAGETVISDALKNL